MKKLILCLIILILVGNSAYAGITSYGYTVNKTTSSIGYTVSVNSGSWPCPYWTNYVGNLFYINGSWVRGYYNNNPECLYFACNSGSIGCGCSCMSNPGTYDIDEINIAIALINDPNFPAIMNDIFPDGIYDANSEAEFHVLVDFEDSEETPAENPSENNLNNTQKADPVHLSNGEYELNVTDFSIGGRALGVGFTRTYGSRREYNSQMGYGWDFNYNMKIRSLASVQGEPNEIVLLDGGCYKRSYQQDVLDPNLYINQNDINAYLYDSNGAITLVEKSGIRYTFDENGNLGYVTDENGNSITLQYNVNGLMPIYGPSPFFNFSYSYYRYGLVAKEYQIDKITDDLGREISFTYDDSGLLWKITDFANRTWTYTHDLATNDLRFVEDPNGRVTEYIYDLRHNLKQIKDPNGGIYITNNYDAYDKVDTQVYGDGTFTFDYNSIDNIGVLTDRLGYKTEIIYTDSGQIETETVYTVNPEAEPNSFTTDFFYNTNNQIIRTIFPDGNSVDYTYNMNGNLSGIYQKANIDDPNDPNDPNVIASEYTYDTNWPNKIRTVTDPMGNTTTYDYDVHGNLKKITYPTVATNLGNKTPIAEFSYNAYGQLETSTSVDGIITKYLYYTNPSDANNYGHLWKKVADFNETDPQALNITTEYKYDLVGNIIEITDPNGNATTLKYNEIDLLKEITNPLNQKTTYTYTPNKKVKTVSRALGAQNQTTTYNYDLLDNLKTITNPLGYVTLYGYTKNEDPNILTDAEENSTVSQFDERGLLWKVTDANNNVTEYGYDKNGNLKTIKDPDNNITAYAYDPFGRLELITYPDSSTEIFSYDKNSNLLSKTNRASQTIAYEYDTLGRLKVVSRPSEPNIVYAYDIAGKIDNVDDRGNVTYFSYDRIGRLEDVNNPQNRQVGYGYDDMSRRQKLTYPDGSFITYQYDKLSRLDKILDDSNNIIADYDYDALGRRSLLILGNDANAVYGYDLGNRLTKLTNNLDDTNSVIFTYDDYDKVGNRLSMQVDSSNTQVYQYDEIYRLIFVDYNDGFWSDFYYDGLGNREEVDNTGTSTYYASNSLNQYTAVGGTNYSYDDNGNLANDGTYRYYYDCQNRLTDVNDQSDNAVASYKYDYAGRRISKTVNSNTIYYVYDGSQIIAEYSSAGMLLKKYIYGTGIDEPICMIDVANSNAVYYYQLDGLGSVVALTDEDGSIIEKYSYDVFGEPNRASSVGNPYMFTGREYDSETGLYSYRARYYKPSIGRFLQTDPIGYADGLNIYAYVGNNPVNYTDPMGLSCKSSQEKIGQLQNYIDSSEAAMIKNIETLEMLNSKKKFWHTYYQTMLVSDAAASLLNWSGTAIKVKNLGYHLTKKLSYDASKAWQFVGWGRATDTTMYHVTEIDKISINLAGEVVSSSPGVAASVLGLNDIPTARRKLINRNDKQIEDIMQNINSLSWGVSQAREEIRRLSDE